MSMQDPLADFLTRIRNAQMAGHTNVEADSSGIKMAVSELLKKEGYIEGFEQTEVKAGKTVLRLALKYFEGKPVIQEIKRISRPGLRIYRTVKDLPRVRNGYGVAIVSTSKGVISDKEAREHNIGGELLATVF